MPVCLQLPGRICCKAVQGCPIAQLGSTKCASMLIGRLGASDAFDAVVAHVLCYWTARRLLPAAA